MLKSVASKHGGISVSDWIWLYMGKKYVGRHFNQGNMIWTTGKRKHRNTSLYTSVLIVVDHVNVGPNLSNYPVIRHLFNICFQ